MYLKKSLPSYRPKEFWRCIRKQNIILFGLIIVNFGTEVSEQNSIDPDQTDEGLHYVPFYPAVLYYILR